MKPLAISITVLVITFFGLTAAFSETERKQAKSPAKAQEAAQAAEGKAQKAEADANSVADANAVTADPNTAKKPGKVKDMKKIMLVKIDVGSQKEVREWTRRRIEDRLDLIDVSQQQVIAEFDYIRNLAVEEGAVKTLAAIDFVLEGRKERFAGIIETLRKKAEEEREREREREEKEQERGRRGSKRRRSRSDRNREKK